MAPKKKKPESEPIKCDEISGEAFHAHQDDVFSYNWWEVFCFPYSLCMRVWDCCMALCAGTNQCLLYWMVIQWIICKITKFTTPDPIIFPYYFYLFCQVFMLTLFFVLIWHWIGKSVVIPYFMAFYYTMLDLQYPHAPLNVTQMSFRKYCFKKSEIFEIPAESNGLQMYANYPLNFICVAIDLYILEKVL